MDFARSAALATLIFVEETASTNDDLLRIAAAASEIGAELGVDFTSEHSAELAAEFTVVATLSQTSGRGRLGRVWVAPPGQTLAASVLLRPRLPGGEPLGIDGFGWLSLLAGLAMTRSVRALLPSSNVSLKWPNDVLVDGKKAAGLLSELVPTLDSVVIGSGVNLSIPADGLPTATSTSLGLHLAGSAPAAVNSAASGPGSAVLAGEVLADAVLAGYLTALRELYAEYLRVGGDARSSGLLDDVSEVCSSLGQQVRVELPGGATLFGVAIALDVSGRLLVKRTSDGAIQAVAAGDVTHLRYE